VEPYSYVIIIEIYNSNYQLTGRRAAEIRIAIRTQRTINYQYQLIAILHNPQSDFPQPCLGIGNCWDTLTEWEATVLYSSQLLGVINHKLSF